VSRIFIMPNKIACFLTAHGFGHAARSCAILNASRQFTPELEAKIFSNVPVSFFEETLEFPFTVEQPCENDVGLVQTTTFHHDVEATLRKLEAFLPFEEPLLEELAQQISDCTKVYADISPLGIAVAKYAGLPVVLFENFTWDWIYEPFLQELPEFEKPIQFLRHIYSQVDVHVQSDPLCHSRPNVHKVPPVSRPPRTSKEEIRSILSIPEEHQLVLVSRGGSIDDLDFLSELKKHKTTQFLFAGGVSEAYQEDNLHLLPFSSNLYHPDLVHAADIVIGKAGYGMISETYASGAPFAYIAREGFRESEALHHFLQQSPSYFSISQEEYLSGAWVRDLEYILELPRSEPQPSGAEQAARLLMTGG